MVEFEGNRKEGFALVVAATDGEELLRSKTYTKKKHAVRYLGRLRGQLMPEHPAVHKATQSVGGKRERDRAAGTEIGDALEKHKADHTIIESGEIVIAALGLCHQQLELLAQLDATDKVIRARELLATLGNSLEAAQEDFEALVENLHDDIAPPPEVEPNEAEAADPLHPTGKCTCVGEGRCDWCKQYRKEFADVHTPTLRDVYDKPDGTRICLTSEDLVASAQSEGWTFVNQVPHADGRFDYICGQDWCRCMQ